MKTIALFALAIALGACTTTTTQRTAQHRPEMGTATGRVYSGDELQRTGHTSVGRQLETLDPDVQSRGPGN